MDWICSGASDGLCDRTGLLHEPWFSKAGSKLYTKDEAEYPWDLCTDIAAIWVLQGTFRRYKGAFLFGEHYSGGNAPLTRAMSRAWMVLEERFAVTLKRGRPAWFKV